MERNFRRSFPRIIYQLAYMTTIYHYFCIKNEYFWNIFKSTFYQNILQNAPNCTIYKEFIGGACPRTPLTSAWLGHTPLATRPNSKKVGPPSPWQILHTPMNNRPILKNIQIYISMTCNNYYIQKRQK